MRKSYMIVDDSDGSVDTWSCDTFDTLKAAQEYFMLEVENGNIESNDVSTFFIVELVPALQAIPPGKPTFKKVAKE